MFPASHKTVILLDRSPIFLTESSKHFVDFDMFMKSKGPGVIPLAPISKSLWTCNVEAALEYARVVYDLFPGNKLIQLIVSDTRAHLINSWSLDEQSLQHMMNGLANLPLPVTNDKSCSLLHGINAAVEVLSQPSQLQHECRTSLINGEAREVANRGRIICLSSFKSDAAIHSVEDYVATTLSENNKQASTNDALMAVDQCELVLIDITSIGKGTSITPRAQKKQLSSLLSSEVHGSQSGRHVTAKLLELVTQNFTLSSTTVTGIPMKEEQNASSSANYDVELFHVADAHSDLLALSHVEGLVVPSREGLFTQTVNLKWCTPKSTAVELQHCTSAFRITPVDVNSRPSSCLTNFLLSGRSVMLEQPRKGGARILSHMLTSHGGEIYIHTLATCRSILEDPPSISEGVGGRLTDYRIGDFGQFMKDNRLAPVTDPAHLASFTGAPVERAKSRLERVTRHWPMIISDTIIFNMTATLEPLTTIIVKDHLEEADVLECKQVIYRVVAMEHRNEALPVTASGIRGKGAKREEQYRQMWMEFERLVRAHSGTSPMHQKVLECLLDCKRPSSVGEQDKTAAETDPIDSDRLTKSLDRKDVVKVEVKQEINEMPVPPVKKFKLSLDSKCSGPQSLLTLWTNRISSIHQARCREFNGRLEAGPGNRAELYPHMKEEVASGNTVEGADTKNGIGHKK